ncbi:MAG: GTPase HflX [Bacteroidales bacterium]|nr:GTPase HflX [Bacteroidales bacterium]
MLDKKITEQTGEHAVLVGLITSKEDKFRIDEYLDELEFLVNTAGGKTHKRFIQQLEAPNSRTFVGSGKINEISSYINENNIDTVVFDDELTPSQLRNIEKELNCKVLDRTNLILDIFAARARTAHAKVQVELAQYEYLLPRLTGLWTHLSKQKGGIGMKGPGEREIETDRRIVRDRITKLKRQLQQIDKQKATQRKNRGKLVRVALVGYTNVGKSTLMNLLSKTDVFAENKLFATLDTTVRKVVVENLPFLISDTVGFIRKLPHGLIESFKSTLDEIRESDIIMHVVDVSHPDFEEQIKVVDETLAEIDSNEKDYILLFNKVDAYPSKNEGYEMLVENGEEEITPLDELKKTWMAAENFPVIFVSAKNRFNLEELKKVLYKKVRKIHTQRYPYDDFLY